LGTNCGKCEGVDLNNDEDVDFADIAIFAYHWLEGPPSACGQYIDFENTRL